MSVICCLDVFPDEVVEEIKKYWTFPLEPYFAASYDRKEQINLASISDYIVTGVAKVDSKMINCSPKLKMIHKWGIGVDKIDLDFAKKHKIKVLITAGLNAIPVAEHAVLLILAASKRVPYLDKSVREGKWLKVQPETRSYAYHLCGRNVGVLGLGNIGKHVAELVNAFGAKVFYYDLYRKEVELEQEIGVTYKPFEELLKISEILTLHAPLTQENTHIINDKALSLMPKGSIIVNTGRGGLIDEKALYEKLKEGHIASAGLDVFNEEPLSKNSPLLGLSNVVLTPHVAGATFNNVKNSALHIRKNIERFVNGDDLPKSDVVLE